MGGELPLRPVWLDIAAPIHPDRKLLGSDHILLPAVLPLPAVCDYSVSHFPSFHEFQFPAFMLLLLISLWILVLALLSKVSSPLSFMPILGLREKYWKERCSEIKPLLALLGGTANSVTVNLRWDFGEISVGGRAVRNLVWSLLILTEFECLNREKDPGVVTEPQMTTNGWSFHGDKHKRVLCEWQFLLQFLWSKPKTIGNYLSSALQI